MRGAILALVVLLFTATTAASVGACDDVPYDLNKDCKVNSTDQLIVALHFGPVPLTTPTLCAPTSIWNRRLPSTAVYVPAGIKPALAWYGEIVTDDEFIGLNPNDPLKPLPDGTLVHVPPLMSADGGWNGVAAFLDSSGVLVAQGQPLVLSPGGNPSWRYGYPTVDIRGDCIDGAHGGSGLSSFAGSIRKGELDSPVRHAIKVNLYAKRFLSCVNGGYRWPATKADSYMTCQTYAGSVPALRMGALLAMLPAATCLQTSSHARTLCVALRDYGAYVVDDTAWDVHAIDVEHGTVLSDGGNFDSEVMALFSALNVVDNNAP